MKARVTAWVLVLGTCYAAYSWAATTNALNPFAPLLVSPVARSLPVLPVGCAGNKECL